MKNKYLLIILLVFFGVSCRNLPKNNTERREKSILETDLEKDSDLMDIYDPWEPFNRRMYYFNAKLDRYLLLPSVEVYQAVVPDPVEKGVHNFFKNLMEIRTFSNALLQGEGKKSIITFNRFAVNSTLGVLGFFDVATFYGLKRQREDFGLTLAKYGMGEGPYLVLPFFGPSNVRDAFGLGVDSAFRIYADPLKTMDVRQTDTEILALNVIDTRAAIPFRYHETDSPFEYEVVRYLFFRLRELESANSLKH